MTWDEAKRELEQIAAAKRRAVREAQVDVAEQYADEMRANVPVVSGELRDSIDVDQTAVGAEIVADAPHAGPVHEDRDSDGYKFMTRVTDSHARTHTQRVADAAERRGG